MPEPVRLAVMARSSLPGFRSLDPERNRRSRMPDDESVKLRAIWVSEAFPPSRLAGLVNGLESLGVGRRPGRDSVADFVRRSRSSPGGGATRNLGFFTRRGQGDGIDPVYAELPEFVKWARGWLENVTPSLTVITIQFDIGDQGLDVLEGPLRADYRTTARPHKHGVTFNDPDHQRVDAMEAALRRLTDECSRWVSDRFPGAFAAGIMRGDHPSCVFMTTRQMTPFTRAPTVMSWPFATGFDADHEAWDSAEWPGLRLRIRDDDRHRPQWWLAGRENDFLGADDQYQEMYGGANPGGWLNRLSDDMCLTLMPHATESLLREMHAQVARSRDTMGTGGSDRWDFARLDVLRQDITALVRDTEPVARELATKKWRYQTTFKPGPSHFLSIVAEHEAQRKAPPEAPKAVVDRIKAFIRRKPVDKDGPTVEPPSVLLQVQAEAIRFRAAALLDAGRQHRDALAVVSTLVAAGESYRLDRRILAFTIIFGLVAIGSLFAAIVALSQ